MKIGANAAWTNCIRFLFIYGNTKLTRDYDIEWRFSGSDIFVRQSGEQNAFKIMGDTIQLYDFYDHYYEIGKHGELIKEIPSHNE